jgi:gamma-glutamylcyclotransferase (GGCT)/AIG2-like uncharacterized protein YtfP
MAGSSHFLLFAYGTLQDPAVQQRQLGRILDGMPDALTGYRTVPIPIRDARKRAATGLSAYLALIETGIAADVVDGRAYPISRAELARTDTYEGSGYRRIRVTLRSGRTAWAYALR